ncbi:MAG TPA: DUF4976 domain-containing protein [Gemmatales bacterium]|nr:DUF4976 domain-containing protein [Gemmatales bacterium]
MRGIRTEHYKLIHYHEPPPRFRQEMELYDLKNDPLERVNLAGQQAHAATKQKLLERIEELRQELGAVCP